MSKPKKGYKRKSLDLKEKSLIKVEKKVVGRTETAKELLETLLEDAISKL